ncbi:hypothetical protein SmJEL517_g03246 [Synchytrium microbalum]|uniref:Protein transport protein SFT2 n=1 Tax=Synchytrium microbalum TaxID=1806994 RepID=A0A507BYY5_9FUNG|nr:uncharacterized protein SmJEL517_g03246 [Synchytrium microbalum]TPX34007.1 hypothetical protein SmJEL517_g03246 [Synchytrium microbalum]
MNGERQFKDSLRTFNSGSGHAPTGQSSAPWYTSSASRTAQIRDAEQRQGLLGGFRDRLNGLTGAQETSDVDWFGLSLTQRLVGFGVCLLLAAICFLLAFFVGLPLMVISPSKFAVPYTFGSILAMASFALLRGPATHLKNLFSRERLPFTGLYFGSMALTLYFSMGLHSYLGTIFTAVIQIICLLYFLGSYVPGGTAGLTFLGRSATSAISRGMV